MDNLFATLVAATVAFAATNIDDIFLLAVYFTQVNKTFRPRHIVIGQYVGFVGIMAISALGFVGALLIPEWIIGLLGFAPIYMGIRGFIKGRQEEVADEAALVQPNAASKGLPGKLINPHILSVAVVTFANGGDNISVYIPMFAGKTLPELGAIMLIFMLGLGLWCYLGYTIGRQPMLKQLIQRFGHLIVPIVLIGLGVYILVESGTLTAIAQLVQGQAVVGHP